MYRIRQVVLASQIRDLPRREIKKNKKITITEKRVQKGKTYAVAMEKVNDVEGFFGKRPD